MSRERHARGHRAHLPHHTPAPLANLAGHGLRFLWELGIAVAATVFAVWALFHK